MIEEVPWFAALSALEQRSVSRQVELRSVRTGRALYYQGDQARSAFFVVTGRVETTKWRGAGDSITFDIALPGEWLGLAEALVGGPYLSDALPVSETSVVRIGTEVLPDLLQLSGFRDVAVRAVASRLLPHPRTPRR